MTQVLATQELTPTDEQLVEVARHGDNRAFDELVRRYRESVYRLSHLILRHDDDAAAILQEVFLSAYHGLTSLRPGARFSTWLYRIATGASLMKCCSQRDNLVPLDPPESPREAPESPRFTDWSVRPSEQLLTPETRAAMAQEIESLPAELRTMFVLRDLEKLSSVEVAEIMGLTVAAVRAGLHRARIALRGRLNRHFALEGR